MKKTVAIVYVAIIVVIIICAGAGRLRPLARLLARLPGGDKLGHFVLVGLLCLILNGAFPSRTFQFGPFRILAISCLLLVVMSCEEATQLFLEHRSADGLDLLANYAGILVFDFVARSCLAP